MNLNESGTTFGTFSVPANKILVIDYAAASVEQPDNPVQFKGPSFTFEVTNPTSHSDFIIPLTVVDPAGWRAEAALRTKIVLKPNEGLNAIFSNFAKIPSGIYRISVEGYLIPNGLEFSAH